jgi:uncharacterized protein YjbI with pentapeptide repeats
MTTRLRSWWKKISKHPIISAFLTLLAVLMMLVFFGGYTFHWDWTGFNRPSKTLWDWLQLLGVLAVPIVVGFGAVWFTTRQGKVADAENKDNQREARLQKYIDSMSELLLHEKLRDSAEEDEVRKIARVRTLTVLRGLDEERQGSVLRFLQEAGLIRKDQRSIDLTGASLDWASLVGFDLHDADLRGAYLWGANLYRANLKGADLRDASLLGANLYDANLEGADLRGANLLEAKLGGANVTEEQLKEVQSLKDAIMPDGSKHP